MHGSCGFCSLSGHQAETENHNFLLPPPILSVITLRPESLFSQALSHGSHVFNGMPRLSTESHHWTLLTMTGVSVNAQSFRDTVPFSLHNSNSNSLGNKN